ATIFTQPEAYADPEGWHAVADRLRREDPVCRIEAPDFPAFYAVTRHADVIEVERQPERFLNTARSVLSPLSRPGPDSMVKTLINIDGEEHRAYRGMTNDWFKPGNIRRSFEPRIRDLARKYVDRMAELGGACDFALDIARFYPLQVIMSILGVPESDEPLMLDLTQKIFGADDPDFGGARTPETLQAVIGQMIQYFTAVTADRRAHPGEDLASVIANAKFPDGRPLDDAGTVGYYAIVATAGHDTTSSTLAGGLEALIRNPEQLALLQREPARIDNAVEEMIRWVTPVRHFLRYAEEDYALRARRIAKGDGLLMSYLSANRDEEVFSDPLAFDAARANASSHLAFGTGVHFCLGANLARMELRTFFRELLPRLEWLELAGPAEYTAATFVGAPKRVPIRYRLRA
ncbi:MAG: cytochrome P450, partial [Actinomycetota bacterium]